MDLMTEERAWLYPFGRGGILPFLGDDEEGGDGKVTADVPNEDAQFGMCLGFVERGLEGTKFIYQTAEGPYVGFGVVGLFLHEFRRHVVGCLGKGVLGEEEEEEGK
jgi:hypothetical protein